MEHYEATTSPLVHGDRPTLFFYGGPYSNFVGGPFLITSELRFFSPSDEPLSYRTVEHFYQAMKATTVDEFDAVRNTRDTWMAKSLGQRVTLRPDWEQVKYEVMKHALRVKFSQPAYKRVMIGDRELLLAEDSPTDFVWGIRDADDGFTGDNLLGKALMEVRASLIPEAVTE